MLRVENDGGDHTDPIAPEDAKEKLLENVTVLDLSRVLAGPSLTQILGDLGATVIKVESTKGGDDTRKWSPPKATFTDRQTGATEDLSAYYLCANRNKKSVCIDFATKEGQALVLDLASRANVVVENMKVGGLAKYGLDYQSVKARNPSIVYCSITSFGQNSSKAHLPGYDFIAQAMSGIMSVTGPAEGEPNSQPYKVGMAVTDVMTGMYGAVGILSTLLHQREQQLRGETPTGQHVDVSLFDVSLSMLVNQAMNWLVPKDEKFIQRKGNAHTNITPYESMRTKDGFISLAVGNNKQFFGLCQAIDLASLALDPRFVNNSDRVQHRGELKQIIEERFTTWKTSELVERLRACHVPCGPINTIKQALEDEQVKERNMIWKFDSMQRSATETEKSEVMEVVGNPLKMSAFDLDDPSLHTPPPFLGQHTEQVLADVLGLTVEEVKRLREDDIVR